MSVWLVMPSKRPPEEAEPVLAKWREMGYKVCVQRDETEQPPTFLPREMWPAGTPQWDGVYVWWRPYSGYAEAVNFLAKDLLAFDPDCDWIVAAGDDTLPDRNKTAHEIARECSEHFWKLHVMSPGMKEVDRRKKTFGVMQPTGDPWTQKRFGVEQKIIEQIAGSPWMGREWCLRANQGKGPLWPGFFHMWPDECLQVVAQQLGVFWQRPDLTHMHRHWGRPREGERLGQLSRMPAFLARANSPAQTTLDKAEFDRLKAEGFKSCLPL